MSQKSFITLKCDAPGCDSSIKLPIGPNGQLALNEEAQKELINWSGIIFNDGRKLDFCRHSCLVNGAKLTEYPKPPEPPKPEERVDVMKLREAASRGQADKDRKQRVN
jgi:hypothetical protein